MGVSSSDRVVAASDVVFRLLGDEAVLLNLRTEQYLGLNPVGARMWTVLTGAESVSAACAELLQEYDVEPARLRTDVAELLDRLVAAQLVDVAQSGPPAGPLA